MSLWNVLHGSLDVLSTGTLWNPAGALPNLIHMHKLAPMEVTRLVPPGTACVSAKTRYLPRLAKSPILRRENQRTSARLALAGICVGNLKLTLPETMDTMLVKISWSLNADLKKTVTLLLRDSHAAGLRTNSHQQRYHALLVIPSHPTTRARRQYSEPTQHLPRTMLPRRLPSKELLLRKISLDPSHQGL